MGTNDRRTQLAPHFADFVALSQKRLGRHSGSRRHREERVYVDRAKYVPCTVEGCGEHANLRVFCGDDSEKPLCEGCFNKILPGAGSGKSKCIMGKCDDDAVIDVLVRKGDDPFYDVGYI